jgi:hypothetical protein
MQGPAAVSRKTAHDGLPIGWSNLPAATTQPRRALALALDIPYNVDLPYLQSLRFDMPRLGSKKSRHGCTQCKTRRVKVHTHCSDCSESMLTPSCSVTRVAPAVHVLDTASSAACWRELDRMVHIQRRKLHRRLRQKGAHQMRPVMRHQQLNPPNDNPRLLFVLIHCRPLVLIKRVGCKIWS